MTALQERFALEYPVDMHVGNAWKRAHESMGKTPPKSESGGRRALKNPHVLHRITLARTAAIQKAGLTVERTEVEIARLAYIDIGLLYNADGTFKGLDQIPEDARRAIVAIEVEELYEFDDEEDAEQLKQQLLPLLRDLVVHLDLAKLEPPTRAVVAAVKALIKPAKDGKRHKHYVGRIHKVKLADKKGALELAGRRHKMFTDKVEHDVGTRLEDILAKSLEVPK